MKNLISCIAIILMCAQVSDAQVLARFINKDTTMGTSQIKAPNEYAVRKYVTENAGGGGNTIYTGSGTILDSTECLLQDNFSFILPEDDYSSYKFGKINGVKSGEISNFMGSYLDESNYIGTGNYAAGDGQFGLYSALNAYGSSNYSWYIPGLHTVEVNYGGNRSSLTLQAESATLGTGSALLGSTPTSISLLNNSSATFTRFDPEIKVADSSSIIIGDLVVTGKILTNGSGNSISADTLLNIYNVMSNFIVINGGGSTIRKMYGGGYGIGTEITLIFNQSVTVKNGISTLGNYSGFKLSGGVDFNATEGDILTLIKGNNGLWNEKSRSIN